MTTDQQKQQQEREAQARQVRLRQSALMIAEDKHVNDEDIKKLRHALEDAQLAEKKFNEELNAIRMDTQLARLKYEQALEKYIDPAYKLTKEEWERLFSRFTRG